MKALKQKTLEMLEEVKIRKIISRFDIAVGAGVHVDFINRMISGKVSNPGVDSVQKVHDFLVKAIRKANETSE